MKTILVLTDLSLPAIDAAVRRAAHLASARGATLKLMYMRGHIGLSHGDATALLQLAEQQLEREHPLLRVTPVAVTSGTLADIAREAKRSDLVVVPERRERSLRAWLFGQPAQRLLRTIDRPLLLVRTEAKPHYERILVGVDLTERARGLLAMAADVDAQASLELFHAVDRQGESYLRSAEVSWKTIAAYRASRVAGAREKIVRLADSFGARRNRVQTTLGSGDAAPQLLVQQEHSAADLVVVGADACNAVVPLLADGVAHSVLMSARSDVLVVPRKHGLPATRGEPVPSAAAA